jgi:hypothetical protein
LQKPTKPFSSLVITIALEAEFTFKYIMNQILSVSNSGNEKQKQPITLLAVLQSPEFLQLRKDCCKELSQIPLCTLNACNKP